MIFIIRGQKVILDSDLAVLYGVGTKVLNQAIKRNMERFPENFMFQLNLEEVQNLRSQIVTANFGMRRYLPHAFTEHGALMAANVLNSPQAISMSLAIVNTFIKLRQMLSVNKGLSRRLDELEAKYDEQFQDVFQAIRRLMEVPEEPKKAPMGFIDSGN
jgi:hypothetical protein